MTSTTESDLASLRALAEEGRYTPLQGGRFLTLFGTIVAGMNLVTWGVSIAPGISNNTARLVTIGFAVLASVSGAMVFNSLRSMSHKPTVLAKAESLVWTTSGIAIGLYMGILTLRGVLGIENPPNVMGLIGVVAFLHYGVAFFTTAGLSRQKWLNIPAAGSFVAAVLTSLVADKPIALLVTSLFVVLLAVIPGVILMRQEKSA